MTTTDPAQSDPAQSDPAQSDPERFDLIIIGSGSGNSIPDYFDGWKIALVERDVFGGTCLNRGCIPSKMFVMPADVAESAKHSDHLGVRATFHEVDWPQIRNRVFGLIDPIAAGGREYRASGTDNLTLIQGTARFVADKLLDVGDRRITADKILLAVGSRPNMPDIAGLVDARHHTSDSIMRLEQLPRRLGIIGGGFIAVEMGHVFAGYGSQVTMFNRSDCLLSAHDLDISDRFTQIFAKRVDLRLGQLPRLVENSDRGSVLLHLENEVIEVDELLVATGRVPNTDLLGVEAGGVATNKKHRIAVDLQMRTCVDGVWAIGDVANDFQLKHVANAEAKVAFWNIAHPDDVREVDYRAVPSAVFSGPQVASVGKTEVDLHREGVQYRIGRRDFGGTAYGWALDDSTSFAKVLVDAETDLILGAHIIGPQAASLIQPLIQGMQFGQTASELASEVFYIHPALTEVVENALIDAAD